MKRLSEKVFLSLTMPTEDSPLSDQQRIRLALDTLGFAPVTIPLSVLRTLYPLCRDCGYDITATLVQRDDGWVLTAVEAGDTSQTHYGLAVDYGSTTIVMELVDLHSGTVIDSAKAVNGQTSYGTDILSRMTFALEAPEHRELLHRVTAETFEALMAQLTEQTGIDAFHLPVMVLSGNTTMIHFLLKLDAWTVFASPYAPVTADPGWFWGQELELAFQGLVYILPAASNYVGGDIISGLLTLDLHKQEEPAMFFDIGTNGELVIGTKDWLLAGAGAAGPALEGYISRFGMRAAPGAIERVSIEGTSLRISTIGNQKPVGICGSGIIDLLAQMRLHGWINIAGELEPQASSNIQWIPETQQYAVVYADAAESSTGHPLYFTQTDIRQYLDTKAAAYTMIDCLLETAGISPQELRHCYLSGAFSAHSDLDAAITIGIFPDLPRDRYTAISNTSLRGAEQLLLNRDLMQEIPEIIGHLYCVQFASIPDFLVRMQAARFIPHTDSERFPHVAEELHRYGQK